KYWTKVLEIMADVVQHPTFPEEEVTRIRKQHLTDLARANDDPTQIADRLYAGLLFAQSAPYGHPVSGTATSIAKVDVEDIHRYFQAHYGPQGATLTVVGDVTVDEVVSQAQAMLGGWTSST